MILVSKMLRILTLFNRILVGITTSVRKNEKFVQKRFVKSSVYTFFTNISIFCEIKITNSNIEIIILHFCIISKSLIYIKNIYNIFVRIYLFEIHKLTYFDYFFEKILKYAFILHLNDNKKLYFRVKYIIYMQNMWNLLHVTNTRLKLSRNILSLI